MDRAEKNTLWVGRHTVMVETMGAAHTANDHQVCAEKVVGLTVGIN